MNKFQNIINSVIEELATTSVSVNPKQVETDLKKALSSASPTTKKAIEAISEPLAASTETKAPSEDQDKQTVEALKKLNFDSLPNDQKEEIMKTLMGWGLSLQKKETTETQPTDNKVQTTNPTSYGV